MNDTRALGAALVTVLVESEIAERLSQAGRERAASWSLRAFSQELLDAYNRLLKRQKQ
jgi:glycosyltransferase involved in cell wall biosynthesis